MGKYGGLRVAQAVQAAWTLAEEFTTKTQLINHLQAEGLGFRRQNMFKVIGNIWERANKPMLDPEAFRFDRVPKELMAELDWTRADKFGIMGDAIYLDKFGNEELHRIVFWSDSYAQGFEYEEEWAASEAGKDRYPGLLFESFDIKQVWHKKGSDYGHPLVHEI